MWDANRAARGLGLLLRPGPWYRGVTYLLIVSSTCSMAGIESAVVLLYMLVAIERLRSPVQEHLPGWLLGGLAMFPLVAVASALGNGTEAPLPPDAGSPDLVTNLYGLRGLYRLALPIVLIPALARVDPQRLLYTLVVAAGLMACYGLIQFHWGVDWFRPSDQAVVTPYPGRGGVYHANGNFSHHLTYAGVLLMLAPLFAALAREAPGRRRWIWASGAVLTTMGVVLSLSRGGWLGAGTGLLLVALRFPRRVFAPLLVVVLVEAATGAVLGSSWLRSQLDETHRPVLVQRLLSVSPSENLERLYLWESAWEGIRARPWLGVGYGNDRYYAPTIRRDIEAARDFKFVVGLDTHMHNVFLQVGFEFGLLGLAAFLLGWGVLLIWNLRAVRQARVGFGFERALLHGASAGLVGMLAAGAFENNFFDAEVQTTALILVGLSLHAGLTIRRGHYPG